MILRALPVELDFDAAVFVGEDFFAFGTSGGGGGESTGSGSLVGGARKFWDDGYVTADGSEGVAVRGTVLTDSRISKTALVCAVVCVTAGIQQPTKALLGIRGEVVLGFEVDAGNEELAVFGVVLVVDGVVLEFEPGAGVEAADGAFALEGFAGEVFGLLAQLGVARHVVRGAVVTGLGVVVFEAGGKVSAGVALLAVGDFGADMGGGGLVVVTG